MQNSLSIFRIMRRYLLFSLLLIVIYPALVLTGCAREIRDVPTIIAPTPQASAIPTTLPVASPTVPPSDTADSPRITPTPTLFVTNEDCGGINRIRLNQIHVTLESEDITRTVIAELADESAERRQGLMCRNYVPDREGMLFIFKESVSTGFWMYNTYTPLDILYIGSEGEIAGMARLEPCPRRDNEGDGAWRERCIDEARNYRSEAPFIAALELPAGWLDEEGFSIDDESRIYWDAK